MRTAVRTCVICLLVAAGANAVPVIFTNGIVNAASSAPVGLPNSSIARGSIFSIYGQNLGPAQSPPLSWPLKAEEGLGGVTVRIQPSSGALQYAILLYVGPGQINAILPSAVPEGQATATVTYNGSSNAAEFSVVKSSVGLLAWNQQGSGPAIVQNYPGPVFNSIAQSAAPGTVSVLWGTGLGPVTYDEKRPPVQVDLGVGAEVWVGGQKATVQYQGRSSSAGQDQINFVVPHVPGCYVPVVVRVGDVVSNTISMSIGQNAMCSDSLTFSGLDPAKVQQKGLKSGVLTLARSKMHLFDSTAQDTTTDMAYGVFSGYDWPRLVQSRGQLGVSVLGACTVISFQGADANMSDPVLPDMLDAGAELTLVGPDGTSHSLTPSAKGSYSALLGRTGFLFPQTDKLYLTEGKYTLTGPGGKDVGPFSVGLTLAPFAWTSSSTANQGSINRKTGLTVAWTGGSGYVTIEGSSATHSPQQVGAAFLCVADAAKGTFTVPPAVLLALPAAPRLYGGLTVGNSTTPVSFSATGLDVAHLSVSTSTSVTASYQ